MFYGALFPVERDGLKMFYGAPALFIHNCRMWLFRIDGICFWQTGKGSSIQDTC